MFKLVKDFKDYQFVYYWIDDNQQAVGPNCPTKEHAAEWLIYYYFKAYSGQERRRRMLDRRCEPQMIKLKNMSPFLSKRKSSLKGRRCSDFIVEVDVDLAKKKLSKLLCSV